MFARTRLDAALQAVAKKRWKRARTLLEECAQDGDREGAYQYGLLHWRGLGGPVDHKAAIYWFRRAGDDGYPPALDALGVAFLTGAGVARDEHAARILFTEAAARGYAPAMANLARISDPGEARALMERAANAGHAPAMLQLSDMLEAREPVDSLAWLYAAVALTGGDAAAKRAKALAKALPARDIAAAQARGRAVVKDIEAARRAARA